jgi:hypothetical protein
MFGFHATSSQHFNHWHILPEVPEQLKDKVQQLTLTLVVLNQIGFLESLELN